MSGKMTSVSSEVEPDLVRQELAQLVIGSRRLHAIAVVLEELHRELKNRLIVVDDEDVSVTMEVRSARACGAQERLALSVAENKLNVVPRPSALFDRNPPTVLLHDAVHDGQAKTGSSASCSWRKMDRRLDRHPAAHACPCVSAP